VYASARTSVTPITTFRSTLRAPSHAYRPIPGQAKIVSVMTAPPMRNPTRRPITVTTGIAAFFITWRQITARSARPLLRAVRT